MSTRRAPQPLVGLLTAAALGLPATAMAQPPAWTATGAGSGAAPTGGPYDAEYGVGAMAGAGLYRSVMPSLGVGLRLDVGGVANEEEHNGSLGNGMMAFGFVSPALRFRPLEQLGLQSLDGNRGLYVELAGGAGLLEDQLEPMVAPGLGYIMEAGRFGIGPTARYMQVMLGDTDAPGGEDYRMLTFGVELVFLEQEKSPITAAIEEIEGESSVPSDEVQRVAGTDDDSDTLEVAQGRVLLDERLFFESGSATLQPDGKRELDQVADMYREQQSRQPWTALRVSAHTDQLGSASDNMELSKKRVESVREYLVSKGIPNDLIEAKAYGEERPLVPDADSPDELQKNRRVELEIVREPKGENK